MSRFVTKDQEKLVENGGQIRKTFPTLSVQTVTMSASPDEVGNFVSTSTYGAYCKVLFTGTTPVEGLENPDTDNCQTVNELFSLSDDPKKGIQRSIDRFSLLASKLGLYDQFNQVLNGLATADDDALVAGIMNFFKGKAFALLVSEKLELNNDSNADVHHAYINFNNTWCRPATKEGLDEIQALLDKNPKAFIWDKRPKNTFNGSDDAEGGADDKW